jgi:diguanylate cyclase (GGDEF)-like protein
MRRFDEAGVTLANLPTQAKVATALAMTFLAIVIAWMVYATGGVRFAYLHLMYVPIVLSGLAFGVAGGLIAAVAGGLLLGPFMPQDTTLGLAQEAHNWLWRLVMFAFIGGLVGTWSQLLQRYFLEFEWRHEHHEGTGLLNHIGLVKELDALIRDAPADCTLAVSVIQLDNFLAIQDKFGVTFGLRMVLEVAERLKPMLPLGALLALVQPDRLAIVVEGEESAAATQERLQAALREPILVDGVLMQAQASFGTALFPQHARTPEELVHSAAVAMHRGRELVEAAGIEPASVSSLQSGLHA